MGDAQKQFLAQQLDNAINSPEYMYALEDMAASGLQEEAMQLTTINLSNLTALDPELAQQTQVNLATFTFASELNALLLDPSKLDIEDFELPINDAAQCAIMGLRSGFGTMRHSSQSIIEYANYTEAFLADKRKVTDLTTVYRQLVIDANNWKTIKLGDISPEQFQLAMERSYIPADMRGGLTEFMTRAQDMGVWGTLSGAAMLASFGYKVANGAFEPGDDAAMRRWGAARDLISFGSVIGHVSKSGATVADTILTSFGANNDKGNAAYQALGLDRTLPQIYDPTSPSHLPREMNWSQFWSSYDNLSPEAAQLLVSFGGDSVDTLDTALLNYDNESVRTASDMFIEKSPLTPAKTSTKIAGTILKTVGAVTDLFGVADIVVGGIMAKRAMDVNDRPFAAANSLQAISGGGVASAGAIGTAALFAPLPAAVAAAAAPLFLAGAAVGILAAAIMIGVSVHRKNKAKQENTQEQTAFFSRLADQGVTQPNWAAKLEYLRYAWSVYGNDNPDPNQSYFDYQQAEWEHFDSINGSIDGSSLGRLSENFHVHNDLTVDAREDPNTVSDWGS